MGCGSHEDASMYKDTEEEGDKKKKKREATRSTLSHWRRGLPHKNNNNNNNVEAIFSTKAEETKGGNGMNDYE